MRSKIYDQLASYVKIPMKIPKSFLTIKVTKMFCQGFPCWIPHARKEAESEKHKDPRIQDARKVGKS